MTAQFSIRVDPMRDLVRIRMSGFFMLEDIASFVDARSEAHRQLRCLPNMHLTLNDVSDMKIQSQEIVTAFREMLAATEFRSRRLAFVAGSTLARAQLMRAAVGRNARCFADVASAEAWLFADEPRITVPPLRRAG